MPNALLVAGLALMVRVPGMWHGPTYDELYHVLGARSYLIDGTFAIHGGPPYDRVTGFTYVVAGLFWTFGDNLPVARLPAVLAGTALVVAAFVWLFRRGERTAAWIAAALIALSPDLIESSQWVRFYSLQHFFVLFAAIAAFQAIVERARLARSVVWGLLCLASLGLAYYTVLISLIPAGAIGFFVLLVGARGLFRSSLPRATCWALVALVCASIGIVGWAVLRSDFGQEALALAQYSDTWAVWSRYEYRFYHWYLVEHYPLLWTLTPLLAVFAAKRQRGIALLSSLVFGVAFLAHSLLAWKQIRYFAYALPFFFILCALGVAQVLPFIRKAVDDAVSALSLRPAGPLARGATGVLIFGSLSFCLAANHATVETLKMLNRARHPEMYSLDHAQGPMAWGPAVTRLGDLVKSSDAFVAGRDIKALYYFGRADYMLTKEMLYIDNLVHPEFTPSGVGVPIVSTPASLETILCRHATGILLFENWQADTPVMIPPDTLAFIRTKLEVVPVPEGWGLSVYRWEGGATARGIACPQGQGESETQPRLR